MKAAKKIDMKALLAGFKPGLVKVIPYMPLNELVNYLIKRIQMLGEIDHKFFTEPLTLKNSQFGKSSFMPAVLEIVIDDKNSLPADIGKKVNNAFFKGNGYGKILFNVCFSCHRINFHAKSEYSDPASIWFNVFFGYYEIDVPRSSWDRPFGYTLDSQGKKQINFNDLARIGKADWNYFSNYIYGVPHSVVEKYDVIDPDALNKTYHGEKTIGSKKWDYAELSDFQVVSGYVAEKGQALVENSIFTPAWQFVFGTSQGRKEFPVSFIPAKMKAALYMSYEKDENDVDLNEPVYRTYMFGGTINLDYPRNAILSGSKKSLAELEQQNEQFLQEQLEAAERLIKKSYRHLGF